MLFLAADLAHTVNINAVNFPSLDLPHHFTVAGAQQPAISFVRAGADNIAVVLLCFRCTLTDAAKCFAIITGNSRIQPCAFCVFILYFSSFPLLVFKKKRRRTANSVCDAGINHITGRPPRYRPQTCGACRSAHRWQQWSRTQQ